MSDTKFITMKLKGLCQELGSKDGGVRKAGYFQHGSKKRRQVVAIFGWNFEGLHEKHQVQNGIRTLQHMDTNTSAVG